MSTMSQRSHLTNSEAWRVVGSGSADRRPGQGRKLANTPNEDHYLMLTALRDRNMNATLLQQHLRSAIGNGFNSDCPKPAPWCRTVCSPTDGMC
ncbi:hypothetical protein TNCV_3981531 [Trichonephila clavipes]|nr:hypothetical protein TNCV_3981531 [Trichonephila clavipes]